MPRRMSVWPVAIQTLTPLGIGIIAGSEHRGPASYRRETSDDDAQPRPELLPASTDLKASLKARSSPDTCNSTRRPTPEEYAVSDQPSNEDCGDAEPDD